MRNGAHVTGPTDAQLRHDARLVLLLFERFDKPYRGVIGEPTIESLEVRRARSIVGHDTPERWAADHEAIKRDHMTKYGHLSYIPMAYGRTPDEMWERFTMFLGESAARDPRIRARLSLLER